MASTNSTDAQEQQSVWERLQERFSRDPEDPVFGDQPQHRGWAIALCLCIAVFLWFIFTMQETYTVSVQLPTEVVNVPEGQALVEQPPRRVQAVVSGQGFPLLQLKYNTPAVPLNASGESVNLTEAVPDLPKNLSLESIQPSSIRLRTEDQVVRRVPIHLRATITTPPTHDLLHPPQIDPDSVWINGARSVVRDIKVWPTERFVREGLRDTLTTRVALSDTLQGLIRRSVQSVRLNAVSRQFTEDTRTINVTVTGEPSTEKWVTLEPSEVQVRYRVLFEQYEEASQAPDFYATVSYDEIRADTTGRVKPELHVPDDLTLRDIQMTPSSLRYYNFVR